MTEQHAPEDWKMLTAEALIQRCVLHIQRIAELQREKAILSELLGSAQGEIKWQQARIAEQQKAILSLGVDIDEYKKENHQLAADARKRIAELERDAEDYRGVIFRYEQDADTARRRITELEAQLQAAQQWQPITGGERVRDEYASIAPVMDGTILNVDVLDDDFELVCYSVILPDDIRLCQKVKLAE